MITFSSSNISMLEKEKQILEEELEWNNPIKKNQDFEVYVNKVERLAEVYYDLDLKSQYEDFISKGIVASNQMNAQLSEQLLQKSVFLNPSNYKALSSLSCIKSDLNQLEESKQLLLRALEIREDYYRIHLNLAIIYEKLNESSDKIIAHYARAIELRPDLIKLVIFQASFLEQQGDSQQAVQILINSLKRFKQKKDVALLYQEICQLYLDLNEFEETCIYAQKYIELNPKSYIGPLYLANANYYMINYPIAINNYQASINGKRYNKLMLDSLNSEDFKLKQSAQLYIQEWNELNEGKGIQKEDIEYSSELFYIGSIESTTNQDQALISFYGSIEQNPFQNNSYIKICKIFKSQGKFNDILKIYSTEMMKNLPENSYKIKELIIENCESISVESLESFFENVFVQDIKNIRLLKGISKKATKEIKNTTASSKQLKLSILEILGKAYLRTFQTILLLKCNHEIISPHLQFQPYYSHLDLLFDDL